MQATLQPLVPIGLLFWGAARILTNPYQIKLEDTREAKHTYELRSGIFWDAATIKRSSTTDPVHTSIAEIRSIRQMEIRHIEFE